jgi:hypothetical protein
MLGPGVLPRPRTNFEASRPVIEATPPIHHGGLVLPAATLAASAAAGIPAMVSGIHDLASLGSLAWKVHMDCRAMRVADPKPDPKVPDARPA